MLSCCSLCSAFSAVVLFLLSHLITPVFAPRYLLPSGIGLAIVLAAAADAVGSDGPIHSALVSTSIWMAIVLFLMARQCSLRWLWANRTESGPISM